MKRPLFIMLCFALVVFVPITVQGNPGSGRVIISQLKSIERQTRTAKALDDAERDRISQRVRELTKKFYQLPKRDPRESAEFNRVSSSIWSHLREQSVDPRMRDLPAWATPRDKEFERQLEAIEARCRKLPKPVSTMGLLGKVKTDAVRRLRDDVTRFMQEYPAALQQYHADMALVRRYKPESRPGVYKRDQARATLEKRALEQLRSAPHESRAALAKQVAAWLDDAKSNLSRESKLKPGLPLFQPLGGMDPAVAQVFPDWNPGDPYPLVFHTWSPHETGVESDYDKLKRIGQQRYHVQVRAYQIDINETLESAWNAARLGAALEQFLGGDPAAWQKTIQEIERLAESRSFRPVDRLTETRPQRD